MSEEVFGCILQVGWTTHPGLPRTFQTEQQKAPGHQKVPPQSWANWGAWSPSWGHLFLVGMRGALIPSRDEQKHEQPWEGWRGEGYDNMMNVTGRCGVMFPSG